MDDTPIPFDLDGLIDAYLRGEATEAQLQHLARLLGEDTDDARALAERIALDGLIHNWFRAEQDAAFVAEATVTVDPPVRVPREQDTRFLRATIERLRSASPARAPRIPGAETTGPRKAVGTGRRAPVGSGIRTAVRVSVRGTTDSATSGPRRAVVPFKERVAFWAKIAVACLILVGVVPLMLWMRPEAAIARVGGEAHGTVYRAGGRFPIQPGSEIFDGDMVVTGDARLVITYPGESTSLILAPGTQLKISSAGRGKKLELIGGQIEAAVAPQPAGNPMRLLTSQADVKVVGTRFALASSTEMTFLQVQDGKVQLTRQEDGQSVDVARGFEVQADAGAGPLAAAPVTGSTDGLIAHWRFDDASEGTTLDYSGHGQRVTLQGTRRVPGKLGKALSFTTSDEYADLGDAPNLNYRSGDAFTYAAWFRTADPYAVILAQRNRRDESAVIHIGVGHNGHGTQAGMLTVLTRADRVAAGLSTQIFGGPVADNQWHHVAVTRSGDGTIELFQDGVSCGAARHAHSPGPITTDLRALGREKFWLSTRPNTPNYMHGSLDDIRVYNRVLSPGEIRELAR